LHVEEAFNADKKWIHAEHADGVVDAIRIIRDEMAGVSLAAFEADKRKQWLVERSIEIISEPAATCPRI
jgi:hypothetical protein